MSSLRMALLLSAGALAAWPAVAQETAPLGPEPALDALVAEALQQNPDLRVLAEALDSARARPEQAKALPDPMVSVLYVNDGWSPSLGEMPMRTLGFMGSQTLPWPGKRVLLEKIATQDTPAAAGGSGPTALRCSDGSWTSYPTGCGAGATAGGPLLFYLQGAGRTGLATDAAGASEITNNEFSLFVQDQWQVRPSLTVNYGLRWDAQTMPETVDPELTAYAAFLDDPTFPSDGTIPDQWAMFQPRLGAAWDVKGNGKSVVRGSFGVYYARQNMLTQVGSVTTNGLQQQSIYRDSSFVTA